MTTTATIAARGVRTVEVAIAARMVWVDTVGFRSVDLASSQYLPRVGRESSELREQSVN